MKQNQDQIPKIYQELGRQLHLPETRIAALEQQIREKAAEQEQKRAAAAAYDYEADPAGPTTGPTSLSRRTSPPAPTSSPLPP